MQLGSVLSLNVVVDTSSANIAASGSSPTELKTAAQNATGTMSIEVFNTSAAAINLYLGPSGSEYLLCTVPPSDTDAFIGHLPRQPVHIPKLSRLSARNTANSAISSGFLIINGWV